MSAQVGTEGVHWGILGAAASMKPRVPAVVSGGLWEVVSRTQASGAGVRRPREPVVSAAVPRGWEFRGLSLDPEDVESWESREAKTEFRQSAGGGGGCVWWWWWGKRPQ